jgi:hypothetical protein
MQGEEAAISKNSKSFCFALYSRLMKENKVRPVDLKGELSILDFARPSTHLYGLFHCHFMNFGRTIGKAPTVVSLVIHL